MDLDPTKLKGDRGVDPVINFEEPPIPGVFEKAAPLGTKRIEEPATAILDPEMRWRIVRGKAVQTGCDYIAQ